MMDILPAIFAVGDRAYRVLPRRVKDEEYMTIPMDPPRERGLKMGAAMSSEDGKYILIYQNGIPEEYRDKIIFQFPDWLFTDGTRVDITWIGEEWAIDYYSCTRAVWNYEYFYPAFCMVSRVDPLESRKLQSICLPRAPLYWSR